MIGNFANIWFEVGIFITFCKISTHIIMQVLVKWYNIYNAPGGPSAHAEWSLFVTCFMTLMGYNTDRLAWTRNVSLLQKCALCHNFNLNFSRVLTLLSFLSCILKCLSLQWLQPRRLVPLMEALMRCVTNVWSVVMMLLLISS